MKRKECGESTGQLVKRGGGKKENGVEGREEVDVMLGGTSQQLVIDDTQRWVGSVLPPLP